MVNSRDAIIKTLLYADIFDFPLNKQEVFEYLISDKKIDKNIIFKNLEIIKSPIKFHKDYYFILGRQNIIDKRIERKKISIKKYKKAIDILSKLKIIPSVKLIGISGGLSMRNAHTDDDIDIFVITEKKLIWTTRFILIVFLKFFHVYRSKNSKNVSNKICLNLILEKSSMEMPSKDIYTAHEVIQLVPVFDRDNTYKDFINANIWVKNFLPNANLNRKPYLVLRQSKIQEKIIVLILKLVFLEKILKFLQFEFMKRSITKEIIKEGFLGFHPFDYRKYVLRNYVKKLKEFGIKQ